MNTNLAKSDALFRFEMTRASLNALTSMISATMSQGDGLADIAMGVFNLMSDQCQELEAIEAEVRSLLAERRKADTLDASDPHKLRKDFIASKVNDGVDAGAIANALNLKRATVEKVIRQLQASTSETDYRDEVA